MFRLAFCSALLLGLLYWMNPGWFDRYVAFWRPAPYEKHVALVTDAQSRTQAAAQDVLKPIPRRGTYTSDGIRLFDQRMVEGDYEPSRGLTLETLEGAKLKFPPGSIRDRAHVRVMPVAEVPPKYLNKDLLIASPCYKILVGEQESYQFSRPMRTTLPYPGHLLQGDPRQYLKVFVSENGQWKALPTQVDTVNQTATAEVSHCSIETLGVLLTWQGAAAATAMLAGVGAALTRGTATGNGLFHGAIRPTDSTYSTANFDIIYTTSGERAVPAPFPLKPAKPVKGIPDFVVLIGEHLETIRSDLSIVTMSLEGRHKVFLEPLARNAAGESKLGGPMWINTNWASASNNDELDRWLRATVAHEMIHVAQRKTLWHYSAERYWVEMTAAYLADLYWERKGQATNAVRDFYLPPEGGRLLAAPMDKEGDDEHYYAFATFLRWLEGKGDTLKLVETVNATGRVSIDDLDAALRTVMGKPLVDLLGEFALDYYHNDLAKGRLTSAKEFNYSARTQARRQSVAPDNLTLLVQMLPSGLPSGGQGVLNVAGSCTVPELPPRCARAVVVHVDHLAEFRKAKLVVNVAPASGETLDGDLSVMLAASRTGASLPTGYRLGNFSPAWTQGPLPDGSRPRGMHVIDNVMAPRGIDHVTVVMYNRSTTRTIPGPVISRWALLRPEWVTNDRVDMRSMGAVAHSADQGYVSPMWQLSGPDCELVTATSPPNLFGGYALYCRKKGESSFPESPRAILRPETKYVSSRPVSAPDTQDYAWTYAVRDRYGNESEKAPSEDRDPFQGIWRGSVSLIQGSLEQPLAQAFGDAKKKTAAKYHKRRYDLQQELAAAPGDAHRESAQRRLDELNKSEQEDRQVLDKVDEIVTQAARHTEWLARLGIPVELQVRSVQGKYSLRVSKIVFRDTGMTDWVPLERKGAYTLAIVPEIDPATKKPVELPKGVPPLYLQLHRPDEILDDYLIETPYEPVHIEGAKAASKPLSYHLRWSFVRTQKTPPSVP